MDLGAAVVADEKAFEVVQPGEGALDDPASTPEPGAVLGLSAGDLGRDPEPAQRTPVLVVVVAAVGGETLRANAAGRRSPARAAPAPAAGAAG